MPRKRIMREFRIDEISCVDNPAQEGARVAIMKRADPEAPIPELLRKDMTAPIAITGESDGHQHGIGIDTDGGMLGLYVGYGYAEGETDKHFHPITRSPLAIGLSMGHTHTIDQAEIFSAMIDMAGQQTGEEDMTEKVEKKEEQPTVEGLQARLARAHAVITLNGKERAHFDALPENAQTAFLAKSAGGRLEEVEANAKAKAGADPVVYTTADGVEIHKSAGNAFIALAKSNDDLREEAGALRAEREQEELEKRADRELAHLPGDLTTRATMLKAMDGIEDASLREAAHNTLKAQNEAMAKAFETHGHGGQPEPGSADDELGKLAKAYAEKNGVTVQAAYAKVLTSAEGKALYDKTVTKEG